MICPGLVDTEMASQITRSFGRKKAPKQPTTSNTKSVNSKKAMSGALEPQDIALAVRQVVQSQHTVVWSELVIGTLLTRP